MHCLLERRNYVTIAIMNDIDVISAAQAAEVLDTTLNTVVRWANVGYLPAVQRGQRGVRPWLFDRSTCSELAARRADAIAVLKIGAAS